MWKKTTLITTKNISSTLILLNFKEKEPPRFIEITGEEAKTKIFEDFERPMRCAKRCHETIATCSCKLIKCYHCGEDPQTYSRNCHVLKKEMEVVRVQTKERIPRQQAIRKLLRLDPHPELIFSHAVKNSSNRTTTKSPNRTDQESQSKSSEDDSATVPSYGHGYYTQGKDQKKRSPPSPPLWVGGRGLKRPKK